MSEGSKRSDHWYLRALWLLLVGWTHFAMPSTVQHVQWCGICGAAEFRSCLRCCAAGVIKCESGSGWLNLTWLKDMQLTAGSPEFPRRWQLNHSANKTQQQNTTTKHMQNAARHAAHSLPIYWLHSVCMLHQYVRWSTTIPLLHRSNPITECELNAQKLAWFSCVCACFKAVHVYLHVHVCIRYACEFSVHLHKYVFS